MGLDEELWDILEDGVGDLVLDEKELLLIEINTLLNIRDFTRNITRLEDHISLLYLKQNT